MLYMNIHLNKNNVAKDICKRTFERMLLMKKHLALFRKSFILSNESRSNGS